MKWKNALFHNKVSFESFIKLGGEKKKGRGGEKRERAEVTPLSPPLRTR